MQDENTPESADLDTPAVDTTVDSQVSADNQSQDDDDDGDEDGGEGGATLLTSIVSLDPIDFYFDVDERRLLNYAQQARKHGSDLQEGGGALDVFVAQCARRRRGRDTTLLSSGWLIHKPTIKLLRQISGIGATDEIEHHAANILRSAAALAADVAAGYVTAQSAYQGDD